VAPADAGHVQQVSGQPGHVLGLAFDDLLGPPQVGVRRAELFLDLDGVGEGTAAWWLEGRPFFGGLQRERIWGFWRRVLHTCHHRTQVQIWLRLAGQPIPAIYGPSGDVKWDEADPTYSVEAAKRGG
jgi:hypothetical protein